MVELYQEGSTSTACQAGLFKSQGMSKLLHLFNIYGNFVQGADLSSADLQKVANGANAICGNYETLRKFANTNTHENIARIAKRCPEKITLAVKCVKLLFPKILRE